MLNVCHARATRVVNGASKFGASETAMLVCVRRACSDERVIDLKRLPFKDGLTSPNPRILLIRPASCVAKALGMGGSANSLCLEMLP